MNCKICDGLTGEMAELAEDVYDVCTCAMAPCPHEEHFETERIVEAYGLPQKQTRTIEELSSSHFNKHGGLLLSVSHTDECPHCLTSLAIGEWRDE